MAHPLPKFSTENYLPITLSFVAGSSWHILLRYQKLYKRTGILEIIADTFMLYPELVRGMHMLPERKLSSTRQVIGNYRLISLKYFNSQN